MNEPMMIRGQVLLGKYRVERILGQGGMGMVVAVRHVELGQLWAMKFLLPAAFGHDESHERFSREAKAAAGLKSEHIARVQDFGRTEDGAQYMLMEYLEGCDLKALMAHVGRLPIEHAVSYVLQVCEAMAEAHTAGIVHRDLKPANLFLVRRHDGRPCVKVLDFGISKQMDVQGVVLTNTKTILGSPLYMSPEQMQRPKEVDQRADIWALGVILYEFLTGTSPFRGSSIFEVTARVLREEPTPLHELREDIPPELETVIIKCLRKCRDERFQSVGELREALAPYSQPREIAQLSVPPVEYLADVPRGESDGTDNTTTTFGQTGRPIVAQSSRLALRMVIGAGLVLVIGGGFVSQCVRDEPSGAKAAASSVPVPLSSITMPSEAEPPKSTPIAPPDMTRKDDVAPAPSSTGPEKPKPRKSIPHVKPKIPGKQPRDPARNR